MKGNHILLCGLLLLMMAACTDEKDWIDGGSQIIVNATLPGGQSSVDDAPSGMRRIALSQEEGSLNISAKWKDGDKIQLFVKQGNKMYSLSPSKVYNIGSEGKTCSFGFQLPSEVNAEKPYTIYGLCDVEGMIENGVVKAKSQLRRVSWNEWDDAFAPMWFQSTGGASSIYANFKHLGTYEVLHVKNTTNKGQMFQHCGFEVGAPWYKNYDSTPLDENYNPTLYACEPGEAKSNSVMISANSSMSFLSWYMPSGERISNAKLLAWIDGKDVKSSNSKSSNATIQRGHAYHMYAEWNGSELRFVDGSIMGLQLSTTSLTLTPGSQGTVNVTSGSGSYDAASNAKDVATVTVEGSKIVIKAVSPGSATITIKDNQTQERAKIEVTVSEAGQAQTETFTVNGVSFQMVGVEGGTFWMGSADDDGDAFSDERPRHQVTLSSFSIGETEVTQELWEAVMGVNPSYFKGEKRPVEKVSWNDCQTFISKLNAMTGKNFRLPTEAEWEYAARGGKYSHGYKYAGNDDIDAVAWYENNADYVSDRGTRPVAQKQANELGLYDMSGNVWEWCQDWYSSSYYSNSPSTNPCNTTEASRRVFRGGSWSGSSRGCRVAYRLAYTPDYRYSSLGLRLAF